MEGKHPKRKRDKYNPYYIYEKDGQAFIAFEDGQGERHRFEISRELYEAFDKFELEDVRYLSRFSRYAMNRDERNAAKLQLIEKLVCDCLIRSGEREISC